MRTIRLYFSAVILVLLTIAIAHVSPNTGEVEMSHVEAVGRAEKIETADIPPAAEKPVIDGQKTASVAIEKPAEPAPEAPKPPATERSGCDYISDYDWDVRLMRSIAMAESGCRPDARGDGHLTYTVGGRTYGYSLGVLQVRILPGREHCDTLTAKENVACAYAIYKSQGLRAWTMYKNGRYLKFY